jgi:hypothetical protein
MTNETIDPIKLLGKELGLFACRLGNIVAENNQKIIEQLVSEPGALPILCQHPELEEFLYSYMKTHIDWISEALREAVSAKRKDIPEGQTIKFTIND